MDYKELVDKLNYYTKKYDEGYPEISDQEWDELYFELLDMEKDMDEIAEDSPSLKVNYDVKNSLAKIQHNHPMLSLAKTKDFSVFKDYFEEKPSILMLKLDGITCSLRYRNGKLVSAETRGNGFIGEDITHNALVVKSIPKTIDYKDELTIDGEIICDYKNFEKFNDLFKNPRNFASGSIRLLNSKECARRNLTFVAWTSDEDREYFSERLETLKRLGFIVTPYYNEISTENVDSIKEEAKKLNYPIDGLVGRFNDIQYGDSLGRDDHDFKHSFAFKFYDELYETKLTNITWSMGRTGVLTPVANFEPVEIDGSTVKNASLHNLTILEQILGRPYVGQKIWVYKANMIIPQIDHAEKL